MSKNAPKILIIGTGDLRNYGCEAIVQGTCRMLAEEWPDAKIYLASVNPEYDRRFLPSEAEPVEYLQRFTPKRIYRGILRRFCKIGNGSEVRMNVKIGRKYDIVLSAGGDNYCQTRDGGIYNLLRDLMAVGDDAVRHGKKYVLWGASVGPFDKQDIREVVLRNLSNADLINVREMRAYVYLERAGEGKLNLHLVGDPAFYMDSLPNELDNPEKKVLIGINLSLLALGHCGVCEEEGIQKFVNQLLKLYKSHPDWKFIGIPHVEEDMDVQNDFSVLNRIDELIADKSIYESLPQDLGARRTKGAIGNLDLLIAARMHCCVGGVSMCVPTLFLTYSPKGVGMAKYAYGVEGYTLECNEIGNDRFIELVEDMMRRRDSIKQTMQGRSHQYKEDALKGVRLLKEMYYNS